MLLNSWSRNVSWNGVGLGVELGLGVGLGVVLGIVIINGYLKILFLFLFRNMHI